MEEENGDDGEASTEVRCQLRETRTWMASVRPRLRVGKPSQMTENSRGAVSFLDSRIFFL